MPNKINQTIIIFRLVVLYKVLFRFFIVRFLNLSLFLIFFFNFFYYFLILFFALFTSLTLFKEKTMRSPIPALINTIELVHFIGMQILHVLFHVVLLGHAALAVRTFEQFFGHAFVLFVPRQRRSVPVELVAVATSVKSVRVLKKKI